MRSNLETDEFLPVLGANVERERLRAGLKQEKVAELLNMSWRNYQRYEGGEVRIGATNLKRLALIFGCDETALMRFPKGEK